jgi:hypothetical protein
MTNEPKTQYTIEIHHTTKGKLNPKPYPVTMRRVADTKPVEIKRAARLEKRHAFSCEN